MTATRLLLPESAAPALHGAPAVIGYPGRAGVFRPPGHERDGWLYVGMASEQATIVIRPMAAGDASEVLAIYQAGLDGGQASFETQAPEWAALSAVSSRRVYAGVVEHSVYVDPAQHGRGVGLALMGALIGSTEAAGIWTIQSSIFPENGASFRLPERAGFRVVGTRERVARHHGRWRDTILIERRSKATGLD